MPNVTLFDARPPFVWFEEREFGINVEASEKLGRPIPKIVNFACVQQHGSKDVVDKIAEEWIPDLKRKASRGDYPHEWAEAFEKKYTAWKAGHELPVDGTPIATWQMLKREQAVRVKSAGVLTVEDLAQYPDSSLSILGLDGRYLRDMAKAWIIEAQDRGVNAKALADANVKIADLVALVKEQRAELQELRQRIENQERRGPGRPRKGEVLTD